MSTSPSNGPGAAAAASAAAHEAIRKMAAAAVNQQRAPGAGQKDVSLAQFKSFVSEAELEESRAVRQQEKGGLDTDDQPEEIDTRPLYERLKEQRLKKQ